MASKNSRKTYIENGYYHVYNRGVEKRKIFQDSKDYKVFLSYLKEYLSPPPKKAYQRKPFHLQDQVFKGMPRQPKNYHKEIELICYSLLPNHFHMLIKQNEKKSMTQFIHSLLLRYSMYFNKRNKRIGGLFQGRYKAKLILEDKYLLHLSRYIHLNPLEYTKNLPSAYSSYVEYLGLRKTPWIKPKIILDFFRSTKSPDFKKINTYKDFVEKYKKDDADMLGDLTLE